MHRMSSSALAATVALLVAGGLSTASAQSNYVYLDQQSSGAGVCAPALPAFEGLVRKRPRAIQNEGSGTAFITCAPPQFSEAADPGLGPSVVLINQGSSTATVACTGVSELDEGALLYLPISTTVPAGGSREIQWEGEQIGLFTSFSCAIPTGVGIGNIYTWGNAVLVPVFD